MSKKIVFEYKGNEYVLEYTRESVKLMEQKGFDVSAVDSSILTTLTDLFQGAFLANHKYLKAVVIEEIFTAFTDKRGLFNKLSEMYLETVESLFDEPDETEGNVKWEANW